MSQNSSQDYSSYSPQDSNTNASPWSSASQSGSGYNSLHLPPINSFNNYEPFGDAQQYYHSLPNLTSLDPFLSDPSTSHSEQQPPPSDQHAQSTQREVSDYSGDRYSDSPDHFQQFIDVIPSQSFPQHPLRPHNGASHNTTHGSRVVDLTASSPVLTMPSITRKRRADTPGNGRSTKVARRTSPRSGRVTPASKQKVECDDAEVVDLVALDEDTQYEDFKRKQQEELVKQQQQEEASRPVKLAEFQCIVCMDNPTDLMVTHCGHLFCSECLHQALYAGNAKKNCPVCRASITVPTSNRKKQSRHGIYALEMKLLTSKKKGKQTVRDR